MLKGVNGRFSLRVKLVPATDWAVRSHRVERADVPGGPQNVNGVLTDTRGRPYLAASGFKGELRSTAEAILRGLAGQPGVVADRLACRPYEDNAEAGHSYAQLCLACQLFGATAHAGLLTINDTPPPPSVKRRRKHVAVDRLSQEVALGPYEEDVIHSGAEGIVKELVVTNFALWQLALLALALREIDEGYARLGSGAGKGLGSMRVQCLDAEFEYPSHFYNGTDNGTNSMLAQGIVSGQPDPDRAAGEGENAVLLLDLKPVDHDPADWRRLGLTTVKLQPDAVHELFAQCIDGPTSPWRIKLSGSSTEGPLAQQSLPVEGVEHV